MREGHLDQLVTSNYKLRAELNHQISSREHGSMSHRESFWGAGFGLFMVDDCAVVLSQGRQEIVAIDHAGSTPY